jgi:serine/threonine protein kinase
LIAVKKSLDPRYGELIRREASILKTLKHPLILELQGNISEMDDDNVMIMTTFVENGSLASHFPLKECCLNDVNRITKVVVGIALALRYLHSRGIIHRDLRPDNILLDWNLNVRIADFGHSLSPDRLEIPSLSISGAARNWPSFDSRYLAPECYSNRYFPKSDVFSFGLILYELLVGEPAFPKSLTESQIAHILLFTDEMPEIPEFVPLHTQELITDCWAIDPDDRPSFEEIVNRLVGMKFKLTPNVNSSKITKFFKEIENWEASHQQETMIQLSLVDLF